MLSRRQREEKDKVGNLVLSIACCRNLEDCAKPYCVLKCGKNRDKTHVAMAPNSSTDGSQQRPRSIHDDVSVNPKFGDVFSFPILPAQIVDNRVQCRIEVRDERYKLTIKAHHPVGGFLDLNLDCSELMEPTSPFRDRWWLLKGVGNGEIHIKASYVAHKRSGLSPRKSSGGAAGEAEDPAEGTVVEADTDDEDGDSPRAGAAASKESGSPTSSSNGAKEFFSKLISGDLKTEDIFKGIIPPEEHLPTPKHTDMNVYGTETEAEKDNGGLYDHWGFLIDPSVSQQWKRLESYSDLRQQRQIDRWDNANGLERVQQSQENGLASLQSVSELFWFGVPEHLRKHVYMLVRGMLSHDIDCGTVGCCLNAQFSFALLCSGVARKRSAAPETFEALLERVKAGELDQKIAAQIETDLPRTFAGMRTFVNSPDGSQALRNVLSAFALHNPVVRYCQGMNLLAGFILCNFPEDSSFWVLVCLTEVIAPAYYVSSMQGLQKDIAVVSGVISDHLPTLRSHMDDVGLPLQPLLTGPILSMFVGVVPATTVARIFDALFVFGTKVLLAASLVILELGEQELLQTDGPSEFQKVRGRFCVANIFAVL